MVVDNADFVGSWMYDPELDTSENRMQYRNLLLELTGRFFMKIDRRESLSGGRERLEGRIDDDIGEATFDGELTPEIIRFTKRYSEEAVDRGGAEEVKYEGKKSNGVYIGKYVIHGTFLGVPKDWEGDFILFSPTVPLRN